MASTPRGSLLSRCGPFESLFSGGSSRIAPLARRCIRVSLLGRIVVTCPEQGGAGRHPASDGTSNPLWPPGILPGSDGVNVTRIVRLARGSPASCRGAMASTPRGSLLSRCGPFESLFSGGSSRIAPLARRCIRVSLLGRIVVTCPEQGGAGRHPASDRRSNPLWLPGILPGSDGVNGTRIVPLARRCVRVSLLGAIVAACLEQGGAGRHPASDGTSNPLWPPGILPGSDGVNVTRIAPLAMWSVRVSLLGRNVADRSSRAAVHSGLFAREDRRNLSGAGRRGTPPCIGRDVQPTVAPRRGAGERWRQRHENRSSRDVVCSGLFTREDRRNLPGAGRRGTPPCIGPEVQPTLATWHRTGGPTHFGHLASDGTSNPLAASGQTADLMAAAVGRSNLETVSPESRNSRKSCKSRQFD